MRVVSPRFVVVNNGQVAPSGPQVAFGVSYSCTSGERIGIVVNAEQGDTKGAGTLSATCNGQTQFGVIVPTRNGGEPNYNDNNGIGVKGVGITNGNQINDILFAETTWTPS